MISFHNGGTYSNIHVMNNIGYGFLRLAPSVDIQGRPLPGLARLQHMEQSGLCGYNLLGWELLCPRGFPATGNAYETHSPVTSPLFTNATTRDFTLRTGSPAIDAGPVLTTTVGSGSGTTLTVADVGYFTDGFGLVAGDTIQVGSNPPVPITAINYGTNTITVTQSIAWSHGQGVSLPYSGSRLDIGVYEYKTIVNTNLPSPTNLTVIQQ